MHHGFNDKCVFQHKHSTHQIIAPDPTYNTRPAFTMLWSISSWVWALSTV